MSGSFVCVMPVLHEVWGFAWCGHASRFACHAQIVCCCSCVAGIERAVFGSRFVLPLLSDAQYACQAALRARVGSQGSVASLSDAIWLHVAEEGARGVKGG